MLSNVALYRHVARGYRQLRSLELGTRGFEEAPLKGPLGDSRVKLGIALVSIVITGLLCPEAAKLQVMGVLN